MNPLKLPPFFNAALVLVLVLLTDVTGNTQNSATKHLPIIDVHVHAMKVNPAFANDLCPWFLANMPGGDPNLPAPNFINTDCADPLKAAITDKEVQDILVATMKRMNMTIVAGLTRINITKANVHIGFTSEIVEYCN